MTDPALSSTRNHQGRPWFGPGAGTPVELRVGPKTTAGHGRGSRRSLITGICYPATRTIRTGARTVSEAWDRMIPIRRRLVGDRWAPGFRDSFRGVSGLGACFVSVVSSQIFVRADESCALARHGDLAAYRAENLSRPAPTSS